MILTHGLRVKVHHGGGGVVAGTPQLGSRLAAGAQLSAAFAFSPGSQPTGGTIHTQCGTPHLSQPNLEALSQTGPMVCFHGDYKSHQVDN